MKYLKNQIPYFERERTKEQEQELEANTFAACLLMPKSLFLEKYIELRFDIDLIEKLANLFQVSSQAVSFRLMLLGLIDTPPL